MELLLLAVNLAVVVLILSLPWVVLHWARRSSPPPRPPLQRVGLGLVVIGVVTASAAPFVAVVLLIQGFSAVANADSASKATQLARNISTAMNCGAFVALVGCAVAVLAGLLLLWWERARRG